MFHDWQIFHLSARHPKIAKLNPPESRHREGTCVVIIWPFLTESLLPHSSMYKHLNKGWCEAKLLMFNYWLSSRQDVADNFDVKALPHHAPAYDLLLVLSASLLPHYRNSQQHIYMTICISFSNKHIIWYDALSIVTLQYIDLSDAFFQSDPQRGYNPTVANISKMLNCLVLDLLKCIYRS